VDKTKNAGAHKTQPRRGIAWGGLLYLCIELEPMR